MSTIERLLIAREKCLTYAHLRDLYYDRFLRADRLYYDQFRKANQELDYDLSNHWRLLLVLARGRWSTLFSAFRGQITR